MKLGFGMVAFFAVLAPAFAAKNIPTQLAFAFSTENWPAVFGQTYYARQKQTLMDTDESAASRILEIGALIRHCQWSVLEARLSEIEAVKITSPRVLEHLELVKRLIPIVKAHIPEAFSSHDSAAESHQNFWPVKDSETLSKLSDPTAVRMKVRDLCVK